MTITFFDDYLLLASTSIADVIANPGNYSQVDFTGDINCCSSNCGGQTNTETLLSPFTTTTDIELTADGIKIYPTFFGSTAFISGVYKFEVKIYKNAGGTITETNCIFVDVDIKCKVAALLKNIIAENKTKNSTEKVSTIAHILHYALVNGSNCGCNCEEMCEVYRALDGILSSIDPQTFIDCGC